MNVEQIREQVFIEVEEGKLKFKLLDSSFSFFKILPYQLILIVLTPLLFGIIFFLILPIYQGILKGEWIRLTLVLLLIVLFYIRKTDKKPPFFISIFLLFYAFWLSDWFLSSFLGLYVCITFFENLIHAFFNTLILNVKTEDIEQFVALMDMRHNGLLMFKPTEEADKKTYELLIKIEKMYTKVQKKAFYFSKYKIIRGI